MSQQLVVGKTNANVQSTYTPWPNTWQYPQTYFYPTTTVYPVVEEYANEVEVDQHEHDATLRFYRRRSAKSRSLVKEITVPLSLLEWLQGGGE